MGCDSSSGTSGQELGSFQSTHPYGVRPNTFPFLAFPVAFQSTHPYGVRRIQNINAIQDELFQSTHPYGVRPQGYVTEREFLDISIHAPVWGATSLR